MLVHSSFGSRWAMVGLAILLSGLPMRAHAQSVSVPLDVSQAITLALERGARVEAAGAAHAAAAARAGWRTSAYLPRIGASASTMRSQYPVTVTPIREPGEFPPLDDTIHEVGIHASWTVFDFGRGQAGREASRSLAEAAGVSYNLARLETVEAVTSIYVRLAQLDAVRHAQQERLDALRTQHEQIEALFEEGRVAQVDVLKLQEVMMDAEAGDRATVRNYQNMLQALAAEIGLDEPPAADDIAIPELPVDLAPSLTEPELSIDRAPQITSSTAQLEAAEASARELTRALYPSVELFASEQLRSGSSWDIDDQWTAGLRIQVSLNPLAGLAHRDAQRAKVREQEAALEDARRQVRVAFEDLTHQIQEAADRAEVATARIKHLDEAYRIESEAYVDGRVTLSDLLATEARLAAGRSELVAARAEYVLAHLRRSVLTGHLTPERAVELLQARP